MAFKGEWYSLKKYTQEQLAPFLDRWKICPRCGKDKNILAGFGLRNNIANNNKRYLLPRPHCRECDQASSMERKKLHGDPTRSARDKRYNRVHRSKRNVRWLTWYHNKTAQLCSVEGCTEIGQRHHHKGYKTREFVWLCRKHHREQHAVTEYASDIQKRARSTSLSV